MKKIFLLSCADSKAGGGVYRYALYENGRLEKQAYLPCDKPMYAVTDGGRLHVLTLSPFMGKKTVSPNARIAENTPTEGNKYSGYFSCNTDFSDLSETKSTLGECACHLTVDGEDSYIVNYSSGNIVKNCSLAKVHEGKGINPERQAMPHTHFAEFSPDKKYVLCCDLGLDTVFVYDRNLNEISRAKVPGGFGVRHLVFSPDGHTVYAVNELIPSVSVFSFDGKRLALKNTVNLPCKEKNSTGAAIRLSKDGKELFVSVREENAVFLLGVDGESLHLKTQFASGGNSPRDINLVGEYVICTNEKTNNVTVIDTKDYSIVDSISLPNPLCVLEAE